MMAVHPKVVDISGVPELVQLAEEVRRSGEPRTLRNENEDIAILIPAHGKRPRAPKGRPLTREDPLFGLIGIGRSGIPGGVSERKKEFLARAYRPRQA